LVAEAVLIVASILVAFAIDAGWDRRLDRIEEQEILADLRVEFAENREAIDVIVELHRTALSSIQALYSMTPEEVGALSPDEVTRSYTHMVRYNTFNDRIGTLDGVISAGKLGLVTDPELRSLLAEWRGALDDIDEEAAMMVRAAERVLHRHAELGWMISDELSADVLRSLSRDVELRALVRAKGTIAEIYAIDLVDLKAILEQIVDRLGDMGPGG
jgi:predicted transcriptional regulator